MFLGTDNLEVVSLHAQIDHHIVKVAEIDITLHIQRVVVMGIDGEVLKQQVRMLDAYGVIIETQLDTIGHTFQIRIGEIDLTIDLWTRKGTLNGQCSFSVTLQATELVGHETIDNVQWQVFELQGCIQ